MLSIYFWKMIFITIHSGEAGVMFRRFQGTVIDHVYAEGLHIVPPWDTLHVYNVRIQTALHSFDVLSDRSLPVTLNIAIRYRPEYELLGVLHQEIGPDYVDTIVIPQVESVMRRKLSQLHPKEIFRNKDDILSKIFLKALDELGQKFVSFNDVVITSVVLPSHLQAAIEEKLVHEQIAKAYIYKLETTRKKAQQKRIEAAGIRDYQKIISTTLTDQLIKWQGVQATLELAQSQNAKVVVIGGGKDGLPIILGSDSTTMPKQQSDILKSLSSDQSK